MNPHFMFNSLNNIRALIDENPEVAKKSINELSNLLRGSFNSNRSNLIPFREDLKLVEDYLSLEKIRFEERLKITIEILNPIPTIGVPKNSATIATIRASVELIFRALKINGIAAGKRSLKRVCQ